MNDIHNDPRLWHIYFFYHKWHSRVETTDFANVQNLSCLNIYDSMYHLKKPLPYKFCTDRFNY